MKIAELKKEKILLEMEILEKMKAFEEKTGSKITNIDLEFIDRSTRIYGSDLQLSKVNLKVEI